MLGLRSRKQSDDIQSLADVPVGVTVTLGASHVDEPLCRRLSQLGLRPGMSVTVGRSTSGGGRIVHAGATRYAIDASTLHKMSVVG
ncbi:FeoA family protein [Corynebacterium amycolatum]|uniref:FeoA family protein n=1 Tax=Corynebacterium amycolatum TaxID=43765 RepID=UPI000C7767DC|nr:FeoA family protein [Corynebacterium amycolatum]PLA36766.1 ferrous iron transport protein A [Corynebacterium amycolatum]